MRKTVWIMMAGILMINLSAFAQSDLQLAGRGYIGAGPMLGIPKFKAEWTEITAEDGSTYKIDPDNSWGIALKGGYFVNEYLAIEARFDYYNKFKQTKDGNVDAGFGFGGADYDAEASVKGFGLSINGKLMYPVEEFALRPYIVAGLGAARYKSEVSADIDTRIGSISTTQSSQSYNGGFGRIGAGTMYFFTENVGADVEVAYNIGFGNLSPARVVSVYAGIVYAFQ